MLRSREMGTFYCLEKNDNLSLIELTQQYYCCRIMQEYKQHMFTF